MKNKSAATLTVDMPSMFIFQSAANPNNNEGNNGTTKKGCHRSSGIQALVMGGRNRFTGDKEGRAENQGDFADVPCI